MLLAGESVLKWLTLWCMRFPPISPNVLVFLFLFLFLLYSRITLTLFLKRSIKILIFNICVQLPPWNWRKFNKVCVHGQVYRIGSPFFPDGDCLWLRAFSQKRQNILMEQDIVSHPYSWVVFVSQREKQVMGTNSRQTG